MVPSANKYALDLNVEDASVGDWIKTRQNNVQQESTTTCTISYKSVAMWGRVCLMDNGRWHIFLIRIKGGSLFEGNNNIEGI